MVPCLVSQRMNTWLTRIPTKVEIRDVVDKMNIKKAPRPNGFTTKLFQLMWGMVREDVMEGLTHLYLGRSLVRAMNHMFITLIPKMEGATKIEEFCPISCMNTIYKIHVKVLANRLTHITPYLLLENQGAFRPI